ncbi:DUF502 domain-containing protein [Gammaproteobacteria bacterium]|nr:DUF502 domain-containing protein [Gammaproteobacteria bacterium]
MFRKYFVAGLLFWLPIIVTLVVVQFIVDIFDKVVKYLPESLQLSTLIGFDVPGSGFILVLLLVWMSGILVANFLGRRIVKLGDRIVQKIPLVRTIHQGVKQGLEMMVAPNSDAFSQVVCVQFPHASSWAIGLVTHIDEANDLWTVFLPTTPNPTSGYVLIFQSNAVRKIDMSVDEALKYIISLGTITEYSDALHMLATSEEKNK